MTYEEADAILKTHGREVKKLQYDTFLTRRNDNMAINYHGTDVITFRPNGEIILNPGGWFSRTTKARINEYSPLKVTSIKGEWFINDVHFKERMIILKDGTVS